MAMPWTVGKRLYRGAGNHDDKFPQFLVSTQGGTYHFVDTGGQLYFKIHFSYRVGRSGQIISFPATSLCVKWE